MRAIKPRLPVVMKQSLPLAGLSPPRSLRLLFTVVHGLPRSASQIWSTVCDRTTALQTRGSSCILGAMQKKDVWSEAVWFRAVLCVFAVGDYLKIHCPCGIEGSTPSSTTNKSSWRARSCEASACAPPLAHEKTSVLLQSFFALLW